MAASVAGNDSYNADVTASQNMMRHCTTKPETDISNGPIKVRSCTDIPCLGLLGVCWLVFITISFWGLAKGNPTKLYAPRDFAGSFCGLPKEHQREPNANFEDFPLHAYMMNVTGSVEHIAKELVCSSAADAALQALLDTEQMSTYMCACCKTPCSSCGSVLHITDYASVSAVSASVTSKMRDLTDPDRALSLFNVAGSNAGVYNNVFGDVGKFFVETCVKQCDHTGYVNGSLATRPYTYRPDPDLPWGEAWDKLVRDDRPAYAELQKSVTTGFTFQALPKSECNYDARYCIPFPGISFGEGEMRYCNFQVASDVASAMGAGLDSIGLGDEQEASHSMGSAMGDLMQTLDVFVIVAVSALCYGFICMVAFRFFVKIAVWAFVIGVFLMMAGGSVAAFILSDRCSGDSLVQSGKTYASSIAGSAATAASGGSFEQESMSGVGEDYRGIQTMTRTGRSCQRWDVQSPHSHATTVANYPTSDLRESYCRNPNGTALTIWCYTTDPATRWELCSPLGTHPLKRECPTGYAIADERVRLAMKVLAAVVGVLALIWLLWVCCLWSRIQVAIALYEAAAQFVYNTPRIILVAVSQTIVAVCWFAFWAFSAASLVSQVPSQYAPEGFYTWAEALGSSEGPGQCNSMTPEGFAWKYPGNEASATDPCSGNLGNITGIEPKCWKCALPRYVFDTRFAISFFTLLWNNELIIAIGICIIAGAASAWFFSRPDKKDREYKDLVRSAAYIAFRYHLGSLAMGAAIIAIVRFVRYVLMWLEKHTKGKQNRVLVVILKAAQFCLYCLEGCLRFVNKNAYIQMAILGTNFCTSARAAFFLVVRNVARFVVLHFFGGLLRLVGLAFIVVATGFTGFALLELLEPEISPVIPMVLFVIFAYTVGNSFMNIFALSAETMLQCLIASEEMEMPDEAIPQKFVKLRADMEEHATSSPHTKRRVVKEASKLNVPMKEDDVNISSPHRRGPKGANASE